MGLTIDNYLTFLTIILASVGGIFALIQWKSDQKLKRAEFINQIIEKTRFDNDMSKTMLKIDYNPDWYTKDFHNSNSDIEHEIDKFLSYIDYICYLYKMKNITNEEFRILKYDINRTCLSPSVKKYLWNLYHFSKKAMTDCPFINIIEYVIENRFIDKNDFEKNDLYEKYLNF